MLLTFGSDMRFWQQNLISSDPGSPTITAEAGGNWTLMGERLELNWIIESTVPYGVVEGQLAYRLVECSDVLVIQDISGGEIIRYERILPFQ